MNYLLQSRKRNSKRFVPYIVGVFFMGFVILVGVVAPRMFPGMAHGIGRPLWLMSQFVVDRGSDIGAYLSSRHGLLERNEKLTQELIEAQAHLATLSVLEHENEEFKKAWGRTGSSGSILASVLVKPPQSMYDTVVLDAGERNGVQVGNSVTIADSVILGTIDEVYEKTSRAKLFSSVDTETQAVIDRTNVSVAAIGRGGGNFELRLPQEVDVVEGDVIRIPGMEPSVLGTVVEIEANPTNFFKRVFCKTPINIAQLRWVSVVTH